MFENLEKHEAKKIFLQQMDHAWEIMWHDTTNNPEKNNDCHMRTNAVGPNDTMLRVYFSLYSKHLEKFEKEKNN